jgi:hypothetical protein
MNITVYLEWFLNDLLQAVEYSEVILEKIIYSIISG